MKLPNVEQHSYLCEDILRSQEHFTSNNSLFQIASRAEFMLSMFTLLATSLDVFDAIFTAGVDDPSFMPVAHNSSAEWVLQVYRDYVIQKEISKG